MMRAWWWMTSCRARGAGGAPGRDRRIHPGGSCGNAVQALRTVKNVRPDVLFLDIQMPKLDGMKLLSMIDEDIMPCVCS